MGIGYGIGLKINYAVRISSVQTEDLSEQGSVSNSYVRMKIPGEDQQITQLSMLSLAAIPDYSLSLANGRPKHDGSGKGTGANKGRGCNNPVGDRKGRNSGTGTGSGNKR